MKNIDIREKAKSENVFLYEIANKLNINDGNLSRKLRFEMSKEEKQKIYDIIEEIKKERN